MKKNGFTIVEILLVLTLVAVLAVPIVVSIYKHMNIASEGAVRENISQMVDNARLLSCSSGLPVAIVFDQSSQSISLVQSSGVESFPISNSEYNNISVISSYKLPGTVKLGNIESSKSIVNNSSITFYPNAISDIVKLEITIDTKVVWYTICSQNGLVLSTSEPGSGVIIDLDKNDLAINDIFR